MAFMNSFKRLDNLCRDLLKAPQGTSGVTAYIESMERVRDGAYCVSNWDADYKSLKHYRYIRNQIAHENYADEESLTTSDDVAWIEDFYNRIMTQTDPLALYHQAIQAQRKPQNHSNPEVKANFPYSSTQPRTSRQPIGCATICMLVVAVTIFIIFHI